MPLFLAALRAQGLLLPAVVRRSVAVALVVTTVALSTMAIGGLRASSMAAARMTSRIEAAGRATGDPRPVVLTTWGSGPRLAWPTFDHHRWLHVPQADVAEAARRLRAAGIDRFLFLTLDLDDDRPSLTGLRIVSQDGSPSGQGEQILVLEGGTG